MPKYLVYDFENIQPIKISSTVGQIDKEYCESYVYGNIMKGAYVSKYINLSVVWFSFNSYSIAFNMSLCFLLISISLFIIALVNIFNLSKAIAPIIAPIFSTIPVFFLMRLVIKHNDNKNKHIN